MRKSRRTIASIVTAGLLGATALFAAPAAQAAYGYYDVNNYPNSGTIGVKLFNGTNKNLLPGTEIYNSRGSGLAVEKVKTGSGYCIQEILYIDGQALPQPAPIVPPKIFYYDGDRTPSGGARANGTYVALGGAYYQGYDSSDLGVYQRPAGGKCDTGRQSGTYR